MNDWMKTDKGNALMDSVRYLVLQCAAPRPEETALVLYDRSTAELAPLFRQVIDSIGACVLMEIPLADTHGKEPPAEVAEAMGRADLILGLTQYSLAHTEARRAATDRKIRYLSLAEYNADMLRNPAVFCDYQRITPLVEALAERLTTARVARVRSAVGTDITLMLSGRVGNCCPGITNHRYLLGSPPDVEANIAPWESESQGTIVVDGAITHGTLGKLLYPVALEIENGKITSISSREEQIAKCFEDVLRRQNHEGVYTLAELGIGLNDKAEICGNMLVDEGAYGCVHFGFGANHTIGGQNKAGFHIDCVLRCPVLELDGQVVVREGVFSL